MRVLFIGGTGLISSACAAEALRRGMDLTLLVRGQSQDYPPPPGAQVILGDVRADPAAVARTLPPEPFDAVVDWVAYVPAHVETDIEIFSKRTRQFVFISSASVYQKPPSHYVYREDTPAVNPYWPYARDKIACEERLVRAWRETGFPITIVRPSHTYGPSRLPFALNCRKGFTPIARLLRGKPLIVHGDGTSLWTVTWNEDFARGFIALLGHPGAIGQTVHITSEEVLNWNQIHQIIAREMGVEAHLQHLTTDYLVRRCPDLAGTLWGDKAWSAVFDNSKIKRLCPGFVATVSLAEGVRRALAWFTEHPERRVVDEAADARWDALITEYLRAIEERTA